MEKEYASIRPSSTSINTYRSFSKKKIPILKPEEIDKLLHSISINRGIRDNIEKKPNRRRKRDRKNFRFASG